MVINGQFALNSLSFGFCSYNILRELYLRNIKVNLFPIGDNFDLTSFDKIDAGFKDYLEQSKNYALRNYKDSDKTLALWHLNGSHTSVSDKYLFTFVESDSITEVEKNILNNQKHVFVSSEESKDMMEYFGVKTPITYIPLGFDNIHFRKLNKTFYPSNVTVIGIMGKLEMRKGHFKAIKALIKEYGGNPNFMIHLHVTNPFFNEQQMNQMYQQLFEGQKPPFNCILYPFLANLSLLNECLNAMDIIVDASFSECWSIPSFSATALGKHNVIHYCSGIKGWSNDKNSTLFNPTSKQPMFDGVFFHNKGDFNIGNWYVWDEPDFIDACKRAVDKVKINKVNEEGLKLQEQFTWKKSVDKILEAMQ